MFGLGYRVEPVVAHDLDSSVRVLDDHRVVAYTKASTVVGLHRTIASVADGADPGVSLCWDAMAAMDSRTAWSKGTSGVWRSRSAMRSPSAVAYQPPSW